LLLVLCVCLGRQSLLSLAAAAVLFAIFLAGSSLYHRLARWIDRRCALRWPVRVVLYLLPVLVLFGGYQPASRMPQPPNQQNPAVSPSGAYVLSMPVEQGQWRLTIRDRKQRVLFQDHSDFRRRFNVYLLWDRDDRVWLYNSDDSYVYFWELTLAGWRQTRWGYGHTREVKQDLTPPEALYPAYVRKVTTAPGG
jgi:hypothetical protein